MGSKMLTQDRKLQMVEISRLLLRCQRDNGDKNTTNIVVGSGGDFRANTNRFDNLITNDETWVHMNAPETKRESPTCKTSILSHDQKVQNVEVRS
ncbi:hypothetical protein ElyMa_001573300 [Elysia marginata]|uniref:Uncharacterized protein n=1 Tax=Elysia marginata TaxID=1093978 RepID=A0AAV4JCJ6_9GAST|nr:hypothetical protein ElyMa_001573300 [Elysia marginata]